MLCSNYNVYIIWYLHIMVSTYYYIYILVDTYYVINGITIVKYLHTVNLHNGGNAWILSTPCPIVKGVYCVCVRHAIELHGAIYTLLVWVMGLVTLTLSRSTLSRSSIGFGTR
jgi:hypothetical protein